MIQNIYVIHHSHTDIGYTDLQEKIIYRQVNYIRSLLQNFKRQPDHLKDFKWNCETYFCVEQFLAQASKLERQDFFGLIRQRQIGISANYLNFTDLVDPLILCERTAEMKQIFAGEGIEISAAMIADINGISLGAQDALLDNGIEFLYANIHCHHGMYPLWQNQLPFFWQGSGRSRGQKLLVWNGEHYNLGNALGLVPNLQANFMSQNYFGEIPVDRTAVEQLQQNLQTYLSQCEEHGYPYSFIPISVSGVFSDNAPPNFAIAKMIESCNALMQAKIQLQMVTLEELYQKILAELGDINKIPVYQGDLTDWWAHGVGSTAHTVKHYKEAQKIYKQCRALTAQSSPEKIPSEISDPIDKPKHTDHHGDKLGHIARLQRDAEDNLLLFAEHTWGHSASIIDPYDDMVGRLNIRKGSYASKAHEAASLWLQHLQCQAGDNLDYYARSGGIRAIYLGKHASTQLVEFYIEASGYGEMQLFAAAEPNNKDSKSAPEEIPVQLSAHPRGVKASFCDKFLPGETKDYTFQETPKKPQIINSRKAYIGSERVKDIENDYDPVSYQLPYTIENQAFRLSYRIRQGSDPGGIVSLFSKSHNAELLQPSEGGNMARFLSPVYECSQILSNPCEDRRLLGRNIRNLHAVQSIGELTQVKVLEQGLLYQSVELCYQLLGTRHSSVLIVMHKQLPRIDITFRIAKKLNDAPESLYLPLSLKLPGSSCYIDKGGKAFRPGMDQIPGTCMEYYLSSSGLIYHLEELQAQDLGIRCLDAPLLYMGPLYHHPIRLCNGAAENNQRPIYSWVMNNIWETNFQLDLSGYFQFRYQLELLPAGKKIQEHFDEYDERSNICFPLSNSQQTELL